MSNPMRFAGASLASVLLLLLVVGRWKRDPAEGSEQQLQFVRRQELAYQPMHAVTPWVRELDKIHHWMRRVSANRFQPLAISPLTVPASVQGGQKVH
jgi:hypothetical protein